VKHEKSHEKRNGRPDRLPSEAIQTLEQLKTTRRHPRASTMIKSITCNLTLESEQIQFLKRHTAVHSRDWRLLMSKVAFPFTARTALAYGAILEFVFAGTLSIFNAAIGPIALLSTASSKDTIRYLCDLVAKETGESLPVDEFRVLAFEISGGSCIVVTLPAPKADHEAHLVGIVTDSPLGGAGTEKSKEEPVSLIYISLEASERSNPTLAEWRFRYELCHTAYGIEVKPEVTPFVDAIEKLMTSGLWTVALGRQNLKRYDADGARLAFHAFDSVLRAEDAPDALKFEAFVGIGVVRAVMGNDVIPLPGVPFEYAIMRKHFCVTCKTPTKTWRRSGSTRYMSNAIIDCWCAECPKCHETRELFFGVPNS
jgi:hypothetical protein